MKHTILLSLAVFCLSIQGAAQIPSPTPNYSESADVQRPAARPTEKPVTFAELQARAKANKTKDDLIFQYDKFRDESVIASKPENLVGSWEGAMTIIGSGGYGRPGTPRLILVDIRTRFAGQTLSETPDTFILFFNGQDSNWQWLKTDKLIYFLFDGEHRFSIEPLASDQDVKSGNKVSEQLAYAITREQLDSLVKAQKAEMRIGTSPPRELKPKVRKQWASLLELTQLK